MTITGNNILMGSGAGARVEMSDAPQTNLIHHYRADQGVTIATGVSNWADQKGSVDFVQATTSKQPTYGATTGANGLDGITFGGSPHSMFANWNISQPFHFFTVFEIVSAAAASEMYAGAIGGGDTIQLSVRYFGDPEVITMVAGSAATPSTPSTLTAGVDWLVDSYYNGASSAIRINDGSTNGGNPGTRDATAGMYLCAAQPGTTTYLNAIITEILVYDTLITGTPLTDLRTYLNTDQYGLW